MVFAILKPQQLSPNNVGTACALFAACACKKRGRSRHTRGRALGGRKRRVEELSGLANGVAEGSPGAAEPAAAQPPAAGLTLGERLAALQLQAGAAVRPGC